MGFSDRAARLLARVRRLATRRAPRPHDDGMVDLTRPDVLHDPYPHYAALRERGPVHYLPRHDFWLVVGYDAVAAALKDTAHFSSMRQPVRFDPVMNEADPPAHTAVRRSTAPFFSAAVVAGLEERARGVAHGLLDELSGRGEVELVREFAAPYVERVVGAFLGLDPDECESLRRRLGAYGEDQQEERFRELEAWSHEQVAARGPGSLAARLLDGGTHPPEAAAGLIKLFWVAGTTTTARLVAACALHLLRYPELRAALRADPARVAALVEEAARLDPPEILLWRTAREGAEAGGTAIPAGAEVRLCVGAANRDPARFRDPDRVVLDRAPNPHLSFGAGPHFCPGSRAARLQVRVAVEALLARWPQAEAARPLSTVAYAPSPNYRGLTELFVAPGAAA
jgi:cytochrome P450